MAIVCWTVFHHAGASVAHTAPHSAHGIGHVARPILHHAVRLLHHPPTVAAPRTWFQLVCKVVPAALAGGGLLASQPLNAPRLPDPPPAIVAQRAPLVPPGWIIPPNTPVPLIVDPTPPIVDPTPTRELPEPAAAGLLLGGLAGLAVIRLTRHRLAYSAGGIQPTLSLPDLRGRGPIS